MKWPVREMYLFSIGKKKHLPKPKMVKTTSREWK